MAQFTEPWEPLVGGDEKIDISDVTVKTLTPPAQARRARISVFGGTLTDAAKAVLYLFGDDPVIATPLGQLLGDGDTLDLVNREQINKFRCLSAESGVNDTDIVVSYFY